MPPKIRKLKADLQKAGFYFRPGKGSHTVWKHLQLPKVEITLSGHDGDDAKPYQIKDVRNALKELGEKSDDPNPKHYSMIIEWSDEDEAYIVTVPELPGCRTHGSTYEEAVQQGQDAIESWIMAAQADNDPIPAPKRYAAA